MSNFTCGGAPLRGPALLLKVLYSHRGQAQLGIAKVYLHNFQ